jgi:hypothetical protein
VIGDERSGHHCAQPPSKASLAAMELKPDQPTTYLGKQKENSAGDGAKLRVNN